MDLLSAEERRKVLPAERHAFAGPIPTQIVSSDEYFPAPQSPQQRQVEARTKDLGQRLGRHQGLTRREFFRTASGMAAAFLAMNEVYGDYFAVTPAEAATPELATERAQGLASQFIMDTHTHFLRDDTRLAGFVRAREAVGKAGWNPALVNKPQTLEDLKFNNYFKEIFLDSDTKVALISSAPSEDARDWFLTNEMAVEARGKINAKLGSRRMLAHAIFTPGQPGWLEQVDHALGTLKPDSMKGYTIGDNTNKALSRHPWRLDDEKMTYPAYERFVKAGVVNVCIHKGLFPPSLDARFPELRPYCDVRDVGKAAKDWPQLNFIIYHGAYRFPGGGNPGDAIAQFDATGRVDWVTDLAEIPAKYGVSNVYADLGQLFAQTTVAQPRLSAALLGTLIRGMGVDHVIWGTDAIWTGSPQWQIEALRRLEIPEAMQRQHSFAPLGAADGPVKTAIFGGNVSKLYRYDRVAELRRGDRLAEMQREYARHGAGRSNLRYGFVVPG